MYNPIVCDVVLAAVPGNSVGEPMVSAELGAGRLVAPIVEVVSVAVVTEIDENSHGGGSLHCLGPIGGSAEAWFGAPAMAVTQEGTQLTTLELI